MNFVRNSVYRDVMVFTSASTLNNRTQSVMEDITYTYVFPLHIYLLSINVLAVSNSRAPPLHTSYLDFVMSYFVNKMLQFITF